ncbi:putative flavin-nucleotide-binding protein [Rhizobium sp. CF122]|uniref:pyridoxamine 5'-phosphate oxidase family protein n=1 Tax=Rhizobium sp. CF122 TaxID=1144312 RepID=UPI000271D3D7|nr:pyridoxamine 5'-phosphate oxidase family protein [Rhizobium sp. CF122]EJL51184.1 putative flavin-nucleotide-binding protein [Rhizobium sp. CF122]
MSMTLRNMTHAECLEMLEGAHYGHLACCHEGQPYLVPIYFAFYARVAYSFSMPGRKVEWMRRNPNVCLQVEEWPSKGSWKSVVLNGRFQELPDDEAWHEERLHAWSLLEKHLNWWEIGSLRPNEAPPASVPAHLFYGIYLNDVSGRIATQLE